MPESPRYLAKIGRVEDARKILHRLRSTDDNDNSSDEKLHHVADQELNDILQVISLEKKHAKMNNYWNMFWGIGSGDLHIARRVQLSIWLQIVQEYVFKSVFSQVTTDTCIRWVGIAAITVYAPTIFAEAGYGARKAQWLSGLNDVCTFSSPPTALQAYPFLTGHLHDCYIMECSAY